MSLSKAAAGITPLPQLAWLLGNEIDLSETDAIGVAMIALVASPAAAADAYRRYQTSSVELRHAVRWPLLPKKGTRRQTVVSIRCHMPSRSSMRGEPIKSYRLHLLRGWKLRQTRRGSQREFSACIS